MRRCILVVLIWIVVLGAGSTYADESGDNVREALSEQKWTFVENSLSSTTELAGKGIQVDSRFTVIGRGMAAGSFVELDDGSLLNLDSKDGGTVRISRDDGKSWAPYSKMYEGPGPGALTQDYETGLAVKTRDGVIVWVYRDFKNRVRFQWNHPTNDRGDVRLDVWSIRSLDDGKTWVDRQRIFEGYCGALIDIMETSDGNIVVPIQRFVHDPGRHIQCTYVSTDNGKHWIRSNIIDLGGSGHHDGNFEGTVTELEDGRLYMLMRTNLDRQWEAYSWDGGITWLQIQPSPIASTSSPAFITRLNSGRLALIWTDLPGEPRSLTDLNFVAISEYSKKWGPDPMRLVKRHYPPGEEPDIAPLHALTLLSEKEVQAKWAYLNLMIAAGSDYWQRISCNTRHQLSLAFSEDDGQTWGEPIVFAKGNRSYCQLWERRPGELWISVALGQDRTLLKVKEEDLLKGRKKNIRSFETGWNSPYTDVSAPISWNFKSVLPKKGKSLEKRN